MKQDTDSIHRVKPIAVPILEKLRHQIGISDPEADPSTSTTTSDANQECLDALIEHIEGDNRITPQEKQQLRIAAEQAGYTYDEFEELVEKIQKKLGQSFLLG